MEVREIRLGESSLALGDISDEQLVAWQQAGIDAAALETALRPVIAKKVELARFERRL